MKKILILLLGILLFGTLVYAANSTVTQQVIVNVLPGEFYVYSPIQDHIYSYKSIYLNLSMSAEVDYFKFTDNGGRSTTLCHGCSSYSRKKLFSDGFHQVDIFGVFTSGEVHKYINFTVDSLKPKIIKTLPKKNSKVNNSAEFYVKYTELNLNQTILHLNGDNFIINCPSGKYLECVTNIDLSKYDGQKIEYWFKLTDIAGNSASSKKYLINVDTTPPQLTITSPENISYWKYVPFNITVNEKVDLKYSDNSGRWRTLCYDCLGYGDTRKKQILFKTGFHELLIRATDTAGNSVQKNTSLVIA